MCHHAALLFLCTLLQLSPWAQLALIATGAPPASTLTAGSSADMEYVISFPYQVMTKSKG
jgi:hypothetical protein